LRAMPQKTFKKTGILSKDEDFRVAMEPEFVDNRNGTTLVAALRGHLGKIWPLGWWLPQG